jgi:predicted MPP superfamily phosphohydrolase
MTRFVYLTDSHVGATALGYRQQPDYPGRLLELTAALEEWLGRHPEVEFVLHGGDIVDAPTPGAIAQAKMLFHFSVPVYLCLGNHDLRTRDALQRWQQVAPGFLPEETPAYSIWREDCCLHVIPNQWSDAPYYWPDEGEAQLTLAQLNDLRGRLARSPDLPHILCMHGPALAVPPEQTATCWLWRGAHPSCGWYWAVTPT